MSTITKEQAQKIIEAADEIITALAGTNEDVHPDSDNMLHLWDDLNDRYAPPEVVSELARIALASLEAEAVAEVCEGFTLRYIGHGPAPKSGVRIGDRLYTATPAPVSVPDERAAFNAWNNDTDCPLAGRDAKTAAWLAWCRRAAMLQGADGALTNEDTKRVGELVMWVKRLAHSLRKANPDSKLQSDAMDYLSRKGLIGVEDILR